MDKSRQAFDAWWYRRGYAVWSRTVDKDILDAIRTVFVAGFNEPSRAHDLETRIDELEQQVDAFRDGINRAGSFLSHGFPNKAMNVLVETLEPLEQSRRDDAADTYAQHLRERARGL